MTEVTHLDMCLACRKPMKRPLPDRDGFRNPRCQPCSENYRDERDRMYDAVNAFSAEVVNEIFLRFRSHEDRNWAVQNIVETAIDRFAQENFSAGSRMDRGL